jgi:hypothetical protein
MAAFVPRASRYLDGVKQTMTPGLQQRINTKLVDAALAYEALLQTTDTPDGEQNAATDKHEPLVVCGMCLVQRDEQNYKQFRFGQSTRYKVAEQTANVNYSHLGPGQGHVYFTHANCPALLKEKWTVYTYLTDDRSLKTPSNSDQQLTANNPPETPSKSAGTDQTGKPQVEPKRLLTRARSKSDKDTAKPNSNESVSNTQNTNVQQAKKLSPTAQ